MKVSVCIITYNHASFLAQCLDSVVSQVCAFDWEVLVGEDESNDGTREIVADYARRFPDRIKPFYRSRKDVIYIDGNPTGRFNFLETLRAAQGDYIALVEGDDYWTDPAKLQIQADYLDAHAECSLCFHDVQLVYENGQASHPFELNARQERYELRDLLDIPGGVRVVPPTASVMFRRALLGQLPAWMSTLPMADRPLFTLLASKGFIGLIDRNMGVYRLHQGGRWSGGGRQQWTKAMHARRQSWMLAYFEAMRGWLEGRFARELDCEISALGYDLVWYYQQTGDVAAMRRHLVKALRTRTRPPALPIQFVIKVWILAFFPFAHTLYRLRRPALSQ